MAHAAVVYKLDEPLKVEEVTYRDIRENEVLVKLAACGLCHSDLSVMNGLLPSPMPLILGHEAAGVVEEVGAKITKVKKGDHVIGVWKPSCGDCRYCRAGRGHLCDIGTNATMSAPDRVTSNGTNIWEFLAVGGFSEYTILTEESLVKIDESMPLDKAALLGCAVMTGFGAATNCADVKEGNEVAVFGCGGVGLNILQGAKHRGAKTIVALDLDPRKLEMAKQFGATHVVDAGADDAIQQVKAVTEDGKGVDFAFDAVGNVNVAVQGSQTTARGGTVVLVGVPAMADKIDLHPFQSIFTETTYKGSVAGSATSADILPQLISLYQQKDLMLDELVSNTYTLAEVNDGMNDLREGKNARGVLIF